MKNCNAILIEKHQNLPLSSGKIDKYEYITGEEVMPLNVSQIIEHIKFTCFPLRKVSERQKKAINDHGR